MLWPRRNLRLAGMLVAEGFLFIWKGDHFFNGDLFFFSYRTESWGDLFSPLKGPDHLWQYRPLTFAIFTLSGMTPLFDALPLLVHAGDTLIVFGILRRLAVEERAALIAVDPVSRGFPANHEGGTDMLDGSAWCRSYGRLCESEVERSGDRRGSSDAP